MDMRCTLLLLSMLASIAFVYSELFLVFVFYQLLVFSCSLLTPVVPLSEGLSLMPYSLHYSYLDDLSWVSLITRWRRSPLLPVVQYRARIWESLRALGIDSKESTPPAYIAWRAGTSNKVVVPARYAGNRLLGSLKSLQIRAQVPGLDRLVLAAVLRIRDKIRIRIKELNSFNPKKCF